MAKVKFNIETITLRGGHSLIIGHCPEKLKMEFINSKLEKDPQEIGQFGLFDASSPNYTTYYPDVSAADLAPQDSEFVEPVFRMLSNVTVNAKSNPIHFPADVLKKSMYKLIGQTINVDHEMATGNAIGAIKAVEWQNQYTTKEGIKVPAGINGIFKIDGKSNPRLARGIMMDPPSIHSNSVTVTFAWKQSHPDMNREEFYNRLGQFDDKGNFIQKVVTDIQAYHETSLVGHGADPFAQKVGKDGKIINPIYAKDRYPLSDHSFSYDWKQFNNEGFDKTKVSFIQLSDDNNNLETQENMDATLRLLETIFGLEVNSLTEENYQEKLAAVNTELGTLRADKAKPPVPVKVLELEGLQAVETEITTLRAFKAEVPTDYKDKISLSEVGKTAISELKEDTKRLYKLSVEVGKEDATILATIEGADYKTLQAFHKQYDQLTEGKFGFTCTKCGSHDVTRASADPKTDVSTVTNKSNADLIGDITSVGKVDTRFIEGKK